MSDKKDKNSMRNFENMLIMNKPIRCDKCKENVYYIGLGEYKCEACGNVMLDNLGKIRKYIDENGPSLAQDVADHTGVKTEIISEFLKQGRVELPQNSKYFLKCEKCGCSLRYGRYCGTCAKKLAGGIGQVLQEDIGETVDGKSVKSSEMHGKMHFLNRKS